METRVVAAGAGIGEAAGLLRAGEVVAFPTETVYGLGADARRAEAIRLIYAAKDRPAGNPLIVHTADVAGARACVQGFPEIAERLAERFWPGPLTLVLPRGEAICPLVSAGRQTVALRCPNHPVAQALLRAFDGPVAAPSANRSGFTSPTSAQHVLAELGGRIPLIVDGGECDVGVESTVLDLSVPVPTVLRPGGVTEEMLRKVLGQVQVAHAHLASNESAASPGQYHRHYAPHTPARRFAVAEWEQVRSWVAGQSGRVALLSYRADISLAAPHETVLLPEDDAGYARAIYSALRDADQKGAALILVLLPDSAAGMWAAVADRLRRATEPFAE